MTLLLTKTAAEVFAPTTGGGAPRGAVMGEAVTWGTEIQSGLESALVTANKVFTGSFAVRTNGERIGITNEASAFTVSALMHIRNYNSVTAGFRVASYWTGTTAAPYQNNDSALIEVFNNIVSTSTNYSWAVSAPNAYNNIPAGVTDNGFRVGVYGWAVSTPVSGHVHYGTLNLQIGVRGTAGFLGPGSGSAAIINQAIGVRGEIVNDSTGSTIADARAGEFLSSASTGEVTANYAIFADAANGVTNYSFYGNRGKLYNIEIVQTSAQLIASGLGAEPNGSSSNTNVGTRMAASGNCFIAGSGVNAKQTLQTLNGSGSANLEVFLWGSTVTGIISHNSTSTTYATSSDYRLKQDDEPIVGALDRIALLRPVRFSWKADPDRRVDGFMAHEVQDVVPEAITGVKDEVDAEGNPIYQGIDQAKLMPLVVAAIQELITLH